MPMKSSENLGTEQENKTETVMSSRKPKAKTGPTKEEIAEAIATDTPEAVAEELETSEEVIDAFGTFTEYTRERIDAIDDQILELIGRRIETAGKLLAEKHSRRINPRDKLRQAEIYARLSAQAEEFKENGVNLNTHQVREVFELLIRLGIENHRKNIIDRR